MFCINIRCHVSGFFEQQLASCQYSMLYILLHLNYVYYIGGILCYLPLCLSASLPLFSSVFCLLVSSVFLSVFLFLFLPYLGMRRRTVGALGDVAPTGKAIEHSGELST